MPPSPASARRKCCPGGCAPDDVAPLLRRYYWSEPAAEVLGHDPAELAGLALGHLELAEVRPAGSATVDVYHLPDGRTVIRLVTDDMPYLVDSVTAEVVRQGVALAHVVHPVVVVRRDLTGRILAFCDSSSAAECGTDALPESWMAVVLDGPVDDEAAADLVAGLRTVLDDVRAVHEDDDRMRARALEIAGRLDELAAGSTPAPGSDPADDPAEAAALLRWLADDNFVFLGARDVDLVPGRSKPTSRAVPGTGLGVLRSDTDMNSSVTRLPEAARTPRPHLLTVTKADARSPVHRRAWLDLVAVSLPHGAGERQYRLVGLFPSTAYTSSVVDVPLVRRRVQEVITRSGVPVESHSGKELLEVLETYPRDELLQVGADELLPVALAVQHLQERRQTRLFLRRDPAGRFWSALVYLPRDRYTTEVRLAMQQLLLERLGGTSVEYTARSTESVLARLHFVVRMPVTRRGGAEAVSVDVEALQDDLAAAARSWTDDLGDALSARHGAEAEKMFARVADAFPAAYQEDFSAEQAVADLERLDGLREGELSLRLWTPPGAEAGERRLSVYRVGQRLLLSEVLPVLQNMGVSVVDERPYEIERIGAPPTWIYDFGVAVPAVELPLLRSLPERFTDAVSAVWRGEAEDDGLGALVLLAGLNWRQVTVVRAYVQWLRQAGLPFGQGYVEQTLAAHPDVVARLVLLFETRFSPDRSTGRARREAELIEALGRSIGEVESLDADRVLTALLSAVTATQRTTYYAMSTPPHPALALKLDPKAVPDLPEPRPAREVWVSSPRVMGVHLRFGAVARGGLRWSDRREDLRTEVLGLVKAQMVKNTVIVPTGAKGGFVVKQPLPDGASRDAVLAEGQACYRDVHRRPAVAHRQLRDRGEAPGDVVAPPRVVRHDGDDTYLVVAADKGTATFSDLANSVALERGFWLGDAFASGGSVGYDHKAMGITARGAWESVTRHFRAMGIDVQREEFTVVGVGDMSGDVFGNGMLLSPHIRLVAAFDHRHVFVDPTPDAATSFAERAPAVRPAALLVGRLQPLADQRRRRRLATHGEVGPGVRRHAGGARPGRRRQLAVTGGADPRDPAGAGRPAVQRRHRHLREGGGGEPSRGRRQGQRRGPGRRRAAAGAGRGGGRQPRADAARTGGVRAARRAGQQRRDRQLGRRRHLRPRGEHQDRAQPGGRCGLDRPRRAGRAPRRDDRRGRRRRPHRQPRAERDPGRRGDVGAQPARRARAVRPRAWSAPGGCCAASRRCPTTGSWPSGGATDRR